MEIGSHCVTHGALTTMNSGEQLYEITSSKQRLESILGYRIKSLAYPHGEFDREICEMTREAGYDWAVGTTRYLAGEFDKRFQLRRKPAFDVSGEVFSDSNFGLE